jgi:DNA polymerase epsilon subunit 1
VQFAPTREPGDFIAWVMTGEDMFKVSLKVPRHFYINTKASPTDDHPGKRVSRILPHGRPSFNLMEVDNTHSSNFVWLQSFSFSISESSVFSKFIL